MSEGVVLELKIPEAVLSAAQASGLLDTPDEEAFDRLTRMASRLLGVPVSTVTVIDRDRQYFKSGVGQEEPVKSARQTPLSHSFCQHVVVNASPLLIPDATQHEHFKHNRAVPEMNVIAYMGVPLDLFGQPFGALCAIDHKPREWSQKDLDQLVDLAACVITEVELRARTRELEATNHDLQELVERQNQFMGMAAHDLRTPLTVAMGYSRLLASDAVALAPNHKRMAQTVSERCDFMRRLIDDILDIEALKSGKLTLHREVQPLGPLMLRSVAINQVLAQSKDIQIQVEEAAGEALCDCDPQKIEQVFNNLLGNAVKYCPPGTEVRVSLSERDGGNVVVIEDNGPGIAAEKLSTIFEPFQRGDCGKEKGTGLGLAIVQSIVQAHDGTISVSSQVGQGTRFTLRLPRATAGT